METPLKFDNKVILVTGAASGIGRATSLKLAKEGALLALSDINPSGLEETLFLCNGALLASGRVGDHFTSAFDVGSSASANAFVAAAMERFSRIDHVFNCAGMNPSRVATADVTDAYWDQLVNTNLKGMFNITRACIPHLQSGASFVNVSSIAGLGATSGFAVYCASKYGVIGFSKCVALELGPSGVRTNVVCPGFIDTPTNAMVVEGAAAVEESRKQVSLGRIGTPEEVAEVACFLMGEESRYVNGSVVEVDGGLFGSMG